MGLLSSQVCLAGEEPPEIGVEEKKSSRKESGVLWLLMWSGMFWGPRSRRNYVSTWVTFFFSDQPVLRFWAEASSGSESLESEDVS